MEEENADGINADSLVLCSVDELRDVIGLSDRLERQRREAAMAFYGLVNIQELNPHISIDLKYATKDNFTGKILYNNFDRIYFQRDVAERLSKVQILLDSIRPGYKLHVYDGVRPVSVQEKMWQALDSLPVVIRSKYVSNPKNNSLHNYGAAVDLTIKDDSGNILDMGAGYDDFREIAYPDKETYYYSIGELTQKQLDNRFLLRKVMKSQGFRQLPTEWWHFNACSRWEAKAKYKLLLEEL